MLEPPLTPWSQGYSFTALIFDYLNMFRCLVVETALPDDAAGYPDLARRRFYFRRFTDVFALAFIPIHGVGMLANGEFHDSLDPKRAECSFSPVCFRYQGSV